MEKGVKTYSHSRLSTFEQCKLKFKFRYIDQIIPDIPKSIEAHLGSCVHDCLEWIYNQVKKGEVPSIDATIVYYSNQWEKNYEDEIEIVNKELTVKDYFNKGVSFLINYYTENQPFKDGTLETEKKITIQLEESGKYRIIGFIDRLSQNLETGELEIHDYKTANTLPRKEKFEDDRQLALYSIALKEMFPGKKIKLIWHYLAHNQKIVSTRTEEQLAQLKEDTLNLIKKIEATTEFPHKKSHLCNWCEYKSMCPAWQTHLENRISRKKEVQQKLQENYPTVSKYLKD